MHTVLYLVFPVNMSQRFFARMLLDLVSAQLMRMVVLFYWAANGHSMGCEGQSKSPSSILVIGLIGTVLSSALTSNL